MTLSHLPHNLCAIVLAGGQSSRMGRDKALLEIEGIPLLQRVGEVALSCSDRVYIVTAWPQRYQHLPLAAKCQFIPEPDPQGPLFGFYNSLAYTRSLNMESSFWVLLLACDLPYLQASILHSWIAQLPSLPNTVLAYLPKYASVNTNNTNPKQKHWEPLCGFYRSECLSHLQAFIAGGGRSFQQWLKQIEVVEIPDINPQMLFNCNTPADLCRISNRTDFPSALISEGFW